MQCALCVKAANLYFTVRGTYILFKNTAVEQSKPLFFLELSNKMMSLWTQFVEVSQEVKKHFGIVWKPSLYL